jgi:hypothetical protein
MNRVNAGAPLTTLIGVAALLTATLSLSTSAHAATVARRATRDPDR